MELKLTYNAEISCSGNFLVTELNSCEKLIHVRPANTVVVKVCQQCSITI